MTHSKLPTISLGFSGRKTTRVGFGCSGITGGLGRRRSLYLLDAAYDAGIRHFDVAPMYGYGTAEEVVGDFVARHSGSITVTTKYGIPPPASSWLFSAVREVIRPLASQLPKVRKEIIRRANTAALAPKKASFSPAAMTLSLESSLRRLKVDHVDLLLLHEAEIDDLQNDGVLFALEQAQASGKISGFGLGSSLQVVQAAMRTHASYCNFVQHEWSAMTQHVELSNKFHLCHRNIAGAAPTVLKWLQEDAKLCRFWCDQVGRDLMHAETLSALLLHGALVLTPGIILFSTRQPDRVLWNSEQASNDDLLRPSMRLYALIREKQGKGSAPQAGPNASAPACVT